LCLQSAAGNWQQTLGQSIRGFGGGEGEVVVALVLALLPDSCCYFQFYTVQVTLRTV